VEAIEGKQFMADCMLSLDNCAAPCICPTHEVWGRMREELTDSLRRTTLAQVLGAKEPPSEVSGRKDSRAKIKLSQIPPSCSRKAVIKRYTGNNPVVRRRTS
jgi:DNA-binding IscR family transcriptional regulator